MTTFDGYLKEQLKDPEFRREYDALESKYGIDLADDDFGCILNCAVRYAAGRQTYMPGIVIDFITPLLPRLSMRTLWCFKKDIENRNEPYGLGHPDIDKPKWLAFLSAVKAELDNRKGAGE